MPDHVRKPRFNDPARQDTAKTFKGRVLVIRGATWRWEGVGNLRIQAPDGTTHRFALTEFSGLSWNSLERMEWKKPAYAVTPGRMVDFIDRRILGYADRTGFPDGVVPEGWEPPVPDGSRAVRGPRGTWRWWIEERFVRLQSPEGVRTRHRMHAVCGMDEGDFVSARVEAAKALRTTFDPAITMDWIHEAVGTACDAAPDPTDGQVRTFVREFAAPLRTAA